jgi:hypothetical protein
VSKVLLAEGPTTYDSHALNEAMPEGNSTGLQVRERADGLDLAGTLASNFPLWVAALSLVGRIRPKED